MMDAQNFELTYNNEGDQLLKKNYELIFIGRPIFKFLSFWQEYRIIKDEDLILAITFKCFSNYYFSVEIKNQFLKEKISITKRKTLLDLSVNNRLIKIIPKEYVINEEFLIISIDGTKIGSVFRKRLKIGSDIYTVKIVEDTDLLEYVLITCMINLNNYR